MTDKHKPIVPVPNLEQRLTKLHIVLTQIDSEFAGIKAIDEAEELYMKFAHAVREHAKASDVQHANKALTIFHDSYHIHKERFGSFKSFMGKHI